MKDKEIIPGRVYAYDCLLNKNIRGFGQVPDNISDSTLKNYLEDPSDAAKLLSNKYKTARILVNSH